MLLINFTVVISDQTNDIIGFSTNNKNIRNKIENSGVGNPRVLEAKPCILEFIEKFIDNLDYITSVFTTNKNNVKYETHTVGSRDRTMMGDRSPKSIKP